MHKRIYRRRMRLEILLEEVYRKGRSGTKKTAEARTVHKRIYRRRMRLEILLEEGVQGGP